MARIKFVVTLMFLALALSCLAFRSAQQPPPCPDACGDRPTDPHCCQGYHCNKGHCVKD
jgi:hypothetical protein